MSPGGTDASLLELMVGFFAAASLIAVITVVLRRRSGRQDLLGLQVREMEARAAAANAHRRDAVGQTTNPGSTSPDPRPDPVTPIAARTSPEAVARLRQESSRPDSALRRAASANEDADGRPGDASPRPVTVPRTGAGASAETGFTAGSKSGSKSGASAGASGESRTNARARAESGADAGVKARAGAGAGAGAGASLDADPTRDGSSGPDAASRMPAGRRDDGAGSGPPEAGPGSVEAGSGPPETGSGVPSPGGPSTGTAPLGAGFAEGAGDQLGADGTHPPEWQPATSAGVHDALADTYDWLRIAALVEARQRDQAVELLSATMDISSDEAEMLVDALIDTDGGQRPA